MNAAILTNEFPPDIYGGAGIHVKFLTQELAKLCHVEARCFGDQDVDEDNIRAIGFSRKLGLSLDESCKDGSRGAFMTTADDIIYIGGSTFVVADMLKSIL